VLTCRRHVTTFDISGVNLPLPADMTRPTFAAKLHIYMLDINGANPKFLQIHQSTYHKILSKCKNEEKEVPKFSTPSQTHKFTVVSQIMR